MKQFGIHRKREFSTTDLEIGKPCWCFNWMLKSSRRKHSVETENFLISKLVLLNSFSVYAGTNW